MALLVNSAEKIGSLYGENKTWIPEAKVNFKELKIHINTE